MSDLTIRKQKRWNLHPCNPEQLNSLEEYLIANVPIKLFVLARLAFIYLIKFYKPTESKKFCSAESYPSRHLRLIQYKPEYVSPVTAYHTKPNISNNDVNRIFSKHRSEFSPIYFLRSHRNVRSICTYLWAYLHQLYTLIHITRYFIYTKHEQNFHQHRKYEKQMWKPRRIQA